MAQRVASLYAEIGADTGGLDKGLARAKSGLQDTASSAKNTGTRFTEMASKLGVAQSALGMTANAAKQVWDIFEQGASMELAKGRFDNLTASIGTTSDALNSELAAATGGMMSNAEMMASASQIISLGLADTQEEVVDLASLTSQLGWDMQQVIMTFANDSVMRLDALGLSVTDVTDRQKALEAQGIATDKAFDMAVIEAGQAKLELLGSAADTGAGGMARLEVKLKNVKSAMLGVVGTRTEGVWSGLANVIDSVSAANDDLRRAYDLGYISQAEYLKGMIDVNTIASDNHEVLKESRDALEEYDNATTNAAFALDGFTQSQDAARLATENSATALGDYSALSTYARDAIAGGREAVSQYIVSRQEEAAATEAAAIATQNATTSYSNMTSFMTGLDGQMSTTTAGMKSLAAATIDQSLAAEVAAGNLTPLEAAISSINTQEGLGLITADQAENLKQAAVEFENLNTVVGTFNTDSGVTVEQGRLLAEKIELIGTTSISTNDQMRLMAIEGGTNVTNLYGDVDDFAGSVVQANTEVGKLKDTIIDGLPSEKTVKIKVITEYSSTGTPPPGGGGTSSGGGGGSGLPEFATGGMVNGPVGMPQLAVVHGGERVLTPEQQKSLSGGSTITISFDGAIFQGTSQQTANQIVSRVAEQLGRY